jgi:large subunit ribosomal protein L4
METKLFNLNGQEVGKLELPETIFAAKTDSHFIHELVKYYLANKRRGTACTKTRGEISGGGRKPWRQKHTGRARHGSTRSPIWRKGGVVFGPRPRSFRIDMPRNKRRLALVETISSKFAQGNVLVVENFSIQEPKTKFVAEFCKSLGLENKKVLFVMDKIEEKFIKALNNIKHAKWMPVSDLNALEVLKADKIVITASVIDVIKSLLDIKRENRQ